MDEAEKYQQRLQAIAEKRRLQEEEERLRREKEEERLKIQQLKRKSLRDQWLMEAPPVASSPLEEPQSQGPKEQQKEKLQTESPQVAEEEEQKLKDLGDGKTHPDKVTPDTSEWRAETLGGDTEHLEHMEQETGEGNQLPEGQRPNPQTAPGLDPQTLMAPLENGGEARSVLGVVEVQVERDLKTGATVIRSVAPRGEAGVAAGEKVFDDGRRSIMRVVGGAGPDPDPEELGQILDVLKGAGLQAVLGGVKVVPNGKDKEDAGVEGKQQGAETKEEKEEGRGTAVERNGFEEEDNCANATHNAPQQRQEGRPSTECPQVAVGGEQQGKGTEGGGAWEGGPVTMTFLGFQELEPGSGSDAGAIIRAERVVVTDEEDETPFVSLNQQGPEPESKPDLANGEVQMEGVGQVPQHQAQGSDEGPLEVAAGGCTSQAPSSSTIQVPPPVQDTPTEEASQDTPTAQGMSTENDPPTAQTTPTEEAPPTAQNTDTEEAPPTAQTTPTEEALPTAQTTPTEEAPSTAQTTATEEAQPTAQGTPTEEAPPTATEEAPPIAQDTPTEEAPPTALETPMEEAQKEGGASGAGRVEGGLSSALVAQMKPPQVAPPGGAGGGVQWEGAANQPVTHRVGQRPPATAAELQPLVPPPKASAQPSHPQPSRANEGGAAPKQKSCQCCSVM